MLNPVKLLSGGDAGQGGKRAARAGGARHVARRTTREALGFTLRATMSICSNMVRAGWPIRWGCPGAVLGWLIATRAASRQKRLSLSRSMKPICFVTLNSLRSLGQRLIPERLATRQRHPRVWSAGCATGEEAYSIAMVLRHAAPQIGYLSVLLPPTSSQSVLAVAAKISVGMDRTRCETIPPHLAVRVSLPTADGGVEISPEIRSSSSCDK